MKKALTIGLTSVAIAATLSVVTAWSRSREAAADTLPAADIVSRVTDMGLEPIGRPVRRGTYYLMHAYDRRGVEMRVVADAQFGDVLSVAPTRPANAAHTVRYDAGPRIIHVPQPGEEYEDRASLSDPDEPAAAPDEDDEEVAPPPRRRAKPRPQVKSDAPPRRKAYHTTTVRPAPVERRTILSAPSSLHDGPTPIRPTPRFDKKAENGAKFPPPPPPGYTPPSNLPADENSLPSENSPSSENPAQD